MSAMEEIRQTFFEECAEQLAELESGLLQIQTGQADSDTVNAVFRAVHSIKGGAGAFKLNDLVHFAHVFETALDELRSQRLEATPECVKLLLRSADALADLVAEARDDIASEPGQKAELEQALRGLVSSDKMDAGQNDDWAADLGFTPVTFDFDGALSEPSPKCRIKFKPHSGLYVNANEAGRLIRECMALGTGTISCDMDVIPLLPDLEPETALLTWTIELTTTSSEDAIREVFEFVDGDCDLSIEWPAPGLEEAPAGELDQAALMALLASVKGDAPAAEFVPDEEEAPPAPVQPARAEAPAPAAPAAPVAQARQETANEGGAGQAAPTIRVDLERVDRLIDLVGELVIHQVMLSQRAQQSDRNRASEISVGLEELEQLTREIQDSVMAIRAQPVKSVFQKLPRLVRETAASTGKTVRLITEGEYTEVDKTVIERLSDPLTHMIRNAIDHGLETPEKRLAAGKPAEGIVRVAAMHRSGRIVIEVSDDGAGINRKVVGDIARRKGLIADSAQLSDEEIDNLIFLPGFSTRNEISELSGRGVGMDVVKRSIQALGGRVSISSQPGKGSLFTLSLPLTLAVLDGMVVTVADNTLVVPLTSTIETLRPDVTNLKPFGKNDHLINVRNKFIPLVDVARTLGYRDEPTPTSSGVTILVEAENGLQAALLFDGIQGQRQVVIKSLEANYGPVPGIAAATILGDGRVALILDVDALVAVRSDAALETFQHAAE
jgi:two-component system chemotaxis sensor kinase CheA